MGVKANGDPDRRHRTADSEAAVTKKVRKLESERDAGRSRKPGRPPTVTQWMRAYISDIAPLRVAQGTIDKTYRPKTERWIIPKLGRHPLDQLTPDHLYKFYKSLREDEGLSANTIVQVHRILSRALKIAVRQEIIGRNPCTMMDAPQPEEAEHENLTGAEARAFLRATAKHRNGTRWSVALALGLRQSEALGLRWKYADLDKGVIYVNWQITHARYKHGCEDPHACGEKWHHYPCPSNCPKAKRVSGRRHVCSKPCATGCADHNGRCPKFCATDCKGHAKACPQRIGGIKFTRPKGKRTRAVPLPAPLIASLRAHREAQKEERESAGKAWQEWDLVWCQPNGCPIDTHVDWEEWKEVLSQAGIRDVRLHDARHTAGTLLGELHVDIHVIQRILGHAQVTTTRIYTDPTDPLTREATDRIGELLWPAEAPPKPE
jgi:integrase